MKRRLLSILLAVCCLFAMIPVWGAPVYAAQNEPNTITIPSQINPVYHGQLDEATAREMQKLGDFQLEVQRFAADAASQSEDAQYLTELEASEIIRQALEERQPTVTVYYWTMSYEDEIGASVERVLDNALAHVYCDGTKGDYLRWSLASAGAEGEYYMSHVNFAYVMMTYSFTYYTTYEQEAEMDIAVQQLLDELDLYDATDYGKVKGIYDYMCANIVYDNDNLEDKSYTLKFTAYAALIHKKAVCQGYAVLFYRLANELGVDTRVITGWQTSTAVTHAWNITNVLAEDYYNLDPTWDAGSAVYDYFLKGTDNFPDHTRSPEYSTLDFVGWYSVPEADFSRVIYDESGYWEFDALTGEVVVSGTGAIGFRYAWYGYQDQIRRVSIGEGITELVEEAFRECVNLETVILPSTIRTLGRDAFYQCNALTELRFKGNAPEMHDFAFSGATITAYYPSNNPTWTSEVLRNYDGNVTWIPYEGEQLKDGWHLIGDSWYYYKNGAYVTGWLKEGGRQYYLNADGKMAVGFQQIEDQYYYFNNSGVMQTGWLQIDGTWYYFKSNGAMQTGWLKEGGTTYYLQDDGKMVTGLREINGKYYFFNSSGAMKTGSVTINGVEHRFSNTGEAVTGWEGKTYRDETGKLVTGLTQIGGKYYFFNASGVMQTGWVTIDGVEHLFSSTGAAKTGWYKMNGYYYYLKADGSMAKGFVTVDGKTYYLRDNGTMASSWVKVGKKWYFFNGSGEMQTSKWKYWNGDYYYMNADGTMATGLTLIDGQYYYFTGDGIMKMGWVSLGGTRYCFRGDGSARTGWYSNGGNWYYLQDTGAVTYGWAKLSGRWYYFDNSGIMSTGWAKIDGKWYYFNTEGVMLTGTHTIDGVKYTFNSSGVWVA